MNTLADKKIKLLLSLNNSKISGIESFTLRLITNIRNDNIDITVAVPYPGQICEELNKLNIKYYIFNKPNNKPYSFYGIFKLFFYFIRNRFDIVHAQAGIVPCILGKLFGSKLVIEHKHGLDFTKEQINNMKGYSLFYNKIKKYFVDLTLTVCENDRKILVNSFKYNDIKVKTIYDGIEKQIDIKSSYEFTNNIIIGSIGRLTFQKGHEYLIKMTKVVSEKYSDILVYIYGQGENYNYYSNLIKKEKLENNVFLKGYCKSIKKELKNMDIFVLPSLYEGIPYIIIEAMSMGLPIITTNVGGISEILHDKQNCLFAQKEDEFDLAKKTIMLIENHSLREKIGIEASKVNDKFKIENTLKQIESIYYTI